MLRAGSLERGDLSLKRIVFVGGGHAHLYSLKRVRRLVEDGFEVRLVSPSPYLHYSGMATGVLSGRHSPEEARIDVASLAMSGGGEYVEGTVETVSTGERTLKLGSGDEIGYDVVSFCTGSTTDVPAVLSGLKEHDEIIPVKPVERLARLRERLLGGGVRLVVAGGGAAGCEVAANAAALVGGDGITLIESGSGLLPSAPERAGKTMRRHLESSGTSVRTGVEISSVGRPGSNLTVALSDGGGLQADLVVAATGVRPPGLFADSGLTVGKGGGMLVDGFLRSVDDARVFGGGDTVSFGRDGLPGFGVYAIRQGPILFANIRAAATGGSLRTFEPQRRNLYVMGLGDDTGLGIYGGLVWRGRSARFVKDYIDRRFIEEYRVG